MFLKPISQIKEERNFIQDTLYRLRNKFPHILSQIKVRKVSFFRINYLWRKVKKSIKYIITSDIQNKSKFYSKLNTNTAIQETALHSGVFSLKGIGLQTDMSNIQQPKKISNFIKKHKNSFLDQSDHMLRKQNSKIEESPLQLGSSPLKCGQSPLQYGQSSSINLSKNISKGFFESEMMDDLILSIDHAPIEFQKSRVPNNQM